MKKSLLIATVLFTAVFASGQTTPKPFALYAVAEGNFGTPNGDVFKVSRGNDTAITVTPPLYQTVNGGAGFDVLQDFEIVGNKAVFITKAGSSKITIANFPSFGSVHTFAISGGQCMGKATTKVYVSYATGSTIKVVDLIHNTLNTVSDPAKSIGSAATYMVQANGYMYVAFGSKIVKIDTTADSVSGTVMPGLGAIAGLQYDTATKIMWILGKSGTPSALMGMYVTKNDSLSAPIVLTGITNAAQLRLCRDKLYFLSGKNVHVYNTLSPVLPTTPVYTSTLGGSARGFAYGKSFMVDTGSGDFVIGHANDYASSSIYEIVDGSTFTQIASGSIANCRIVNEVFLRTGQMSIPPVPVVAVLPDVIAQCDTTLTAPVAMSGTVAINGTTADPLTYSAPGTYTLTWVYSNGEDTVSQPQRVIIDDTTPPVPDVASLPALTVGCPYTLASYPVATDNCNGSITATTTSPLSYTTSGTYTVTWTYTDSSANVATQTQTIIVDCGPTSVRDLPLPAFAAHVYPNPASNELHFRMEQATKWTLSLRDITGREILGRSSDKSHDVLPVHDLSDGVYFVTLFDVQTGRSVTQKVIIQH